MNRSSDTFSSKSVVNFLITLLKIIGYVNYTSLTVITVFSFLLKFVNTNLNFPNYRSLLKSHRLRSSVQRCVTRKWLLYGFLLRSTDVRCSVIRGSTVSAENVSCCFHVGILYPSSFQDQFRSDHADKRYSLDFSLVKFYSVPLNRVTSSSLKQIKVRFMKKFLYLIQTCASSQNMFPFNSFST